VSPVPPPPLLPQVAAAASKVEAVLLARQVWDMAIAADPLVLRRLQEVTRLQAEEAAPGSKVCGERGWARLVVGRFRSIGRGLRMRSR